MRVRGFNITTSQGVTAGMVEPPYLTLQIWPKGNGLVVIIFVTHISKYESPMASWLHVLFCRKEKFKEKREWKEGNYKVIKAAYITEAPHCLQCYRSSRHSPGLLSLGGSVLIALVDGYPTGSSMESVQSSHRCSHLGIALNLLGVSEIWGHS